MCERKGKVGGWGEGEGRGGGYLMVLNLQRPVIDSEKLPKGVR